ncbi:MAG: YeeE/YedE family protein [Bacillota bacterium]
MNPGQKGQRILALVLAGLALWAGRYLGTQAAGWFLALAAGYALNRSRVCFVAGFRDPFISGSSVMARALLAGLFLATLLYFPFQYQAYQAGTVLPGNVLPVGLNTLAGGLLHGAGMVLAGGCITGVLTRTGDGMVTQLVSLMGAVTGATVAAYHWDRWASYGWRLAPVHLPSLLGWPLALLSQLAALAGLMLYLYRRQLRQYAEVRASAPGKVRRVARQHALVDRWLARPWPSIAGTLALALVSAAYLYTYGLPLGASSAFPRWGARLWALVGGQPASWPYFAGGSQLVTSLWLDPRSISNAGLVAGSAMASLLAGTLRLRVPKSHRQVGVALAGGVILGYGARLAPGCNLGAFFIAIPSMSLHGWVWALGALGGTWLGVHALVRALGDS